MARKLLIYTDLDGTLLDARDYSFNSAKKALGILQGAGIPVIICSSKTRAEILSIRQRLRNTHPFISENGGGIYLPIGYFPFEPPGVSYTEGYLVTELGTPYPKLREALSVLKARGFQLKGFGDMTDDEVAELTGLPTIEEAMLAKAREFDEPFILIGDGEKTQNIKEAIMDLGLNFTRGRLMHILGDCDKGRAVKIVTEHYSREYGEVITCGLGDSPNDLPMLKVVDYPFLVQKPGGYHDPEVNDDRIVRVDGVGPEGWAKAVTGLLMELRIS